MTEKKEKQQIRKFKRMEPENVEHFCFINDLNTLRLINYHHCWTIMFYRLVTARIRTSLSVGYA